MGFKTVLIAEMLGFRLIHDKPAISKPRLLPPTHHHPELWMPPIHGRITSKVGATRAIHRAILGLAPKLALFFTRSGACLAPIGTIFRAIFRLARKIRAKNFQDCLGPRQDHAGLLC
jgi:hypothetical protein